jgi:predicted TPR repeat methyltransferase
MKDLDHWLKEVYTAGGDREILDRLYDAWAQEYDQHLWASGNPYIAIAAGMVCRHLAGFDACILDAGCGTGNMGHVLHEIGYTRIDGLDPAEGMLAMAARKGFYHQLHRLTLGAEVDLPPESYDAVVAAGVLTHGHAPPESLDGMLKLVKPGGLIVFSLSQIAHDDLGFGDRIASLEFAGKMQSLDRSRLFRTYPFSEQEAHLRHWVCAYRKPD